MADKFGSVDQECFEFTSKNCCWRAKDGWCKFRHRHDEKLLSLEEAGKGSVTPEGQNNGGGGGGNNNNNNRRASGGGRPKLVKDDDEEEVAKEKGEDEEIRELKEKLNGRMDTGNLEDAGGVEIDLLEHPVIGDALVKRDAVTKKKVFRSLAGSKVLRAKLQMTLLRIHESAPVRGGRVLGVEGASMILDEINKKCDALGIGEADVNKVKAYMDKMMKNNEVPKGSEGLAMMSEIAKMLKDEMTAFRSELGGGGGGMTPRVASIASPTRKRPKKTRSPKKTPVRGGAAAGSSAAVGAFGGLRWFRGTWRRCCRNGIFVWSECGSEPVCECCGGGGRECEPKS